MGKSDSFGSQARPFYGPLSETKTFLTSHLSSALGSCNGSRQLLPRQRAAAQRLRNHSNRPFLKNDGRTGSLPD